MRLRMPTPWGRTGLRATMVPGSSLSAAELDALWALRREVVDFRPGQDLEADRTTITAMLARATLVCTMRDRAGEVQGMWMVNELSLKSEGEACVVVHVDQWFLRKAYRGDPTNTLSIFRYAVSMMRRHARSRWFIAGIAGPMSYIFLQRWLGQVSTPLDAELPGREKKLLEAWMARVMAAHGERTGSERQLVPTLALMPEIPAHIRERADLRAALERYERLNPHWREGWALPMIGEINIRILWRLLGRTAQRALGKRR